VTLNKEERGQLEKALHREIAKHLRYDSLMVSQVFKKAVERGAVAAMTYKAQAKCNKKSADCVSRMMNKKPG
jgi:hypothetical protein